MLPRKRTRTVPLRRLSQSFPLRILWATAVVGTLLLLRPSHSGAQNGQECIRTHLRQSQRPWMTASGAWNGQDLLLADSVRKAILRYTDTGRALGPLSRPATDELRSFSPERILGVREGSEFVLELKDDQFATLDSAYRLVRRWNGSAVQDVRTNALRKSDSAHVMRIHNWTMAESDMVAFADLRHPGRGWSSSFVRFPMAQPGNFSTLSVNLSRNAEDFYLLGYSYLTSLGKAAYILLMEEPEMRIVESPKTPKGVTAEVRSLSRATRQLFAGRTPPLLPTFDQKEDFAAVMRVVEESEMPTGIYGWGSHLYVVSRSPDAGGTKWSLSKVDPGGDKLVATMTLPTRANHLTVIPGPDKWAFVEKGPVKGFTAQSIDSLLFVPSSRILKMSSRGNLCP